MGIWRAKKGFRVDLLDHLGVLWSEGISLFYKDPRFLPRHARVNFAALFPTHISLPLALLLLLYLFQSGFTGSSWPLFLSTKLWILLKNRLANRWKLAIFLLLGGLLGVMQTDIVLTFNDQSEINDPFKSEKDLADQLACGRYKAVYNGNYYLFLLAPKPPYANELEEKFGKSAIYNPPIKIELYQHTEKLLLGPGAYVYIGGDEDISDKCFIKQRTIREYDYLSVFLRPGLKAETAPLDLASILNIRKFVSLAKSRYSAKRQKNPCRFYQEPAEHRSMGFAQLDGLFLVLAMFLGISTATFLTEFLSTRLSPIRAVEFFRIKKERHPDGEIER